MKPVKVNKNELLDKIKTNRDNHRALFEKAQEVYREEVIAWLDRRLQDVRDGKKIEHFISLPVPEDHTEDYDRAIQMLEMSVDDQVEIDEGSFNQFVLDQWGWQRSFAANTEAYTNGALAGAGSR